MISQCQTTVPGSQSAWKGGSDVLDSTLRDDTVSWRVRYTVARTKYVAEHAAKRAFFGFGFALRVEIHRPGSARPMFLSYVRPRNVAKSCSMQNQNPRRTATWRYQLKNLNKSQDPKPKIQVQNLNLGLENFGFWIPFFGGPAHVPLGNSQRSEARIPSGPSWWPVWMCFFGYGIFRPRPIYAACAPSSATFFLHQTFLHQKAKKGTPVRSKPRL